MVLLHTTKSRAVGTVTAAPGPLGTTAPNQTLPNVAGTLSSRNQRASPAFINVLLPLALTAPAPPQPNNTDDANATTVGLANTAEINILTSALSGLFHSSSLLDDKALAHLMASLSHLSSDFILAVQSTAVKPSALLPPRPAVTPQRSEAMRMFGISKLGECAKANLFRIGSLWDVVAAHMTTMAQHPSTSVRAFAVESLASVIIAALSDKTHPPMEEGGQSLQRRLLAPLIVISQSDSSDTRELLLSHAYNILQQCGDTLGEGWQDMVELARVCSATPQCTRAFKLLQYTCTDYLHTLPIPCVLLLIASIQHFVGQTNDLNISLTAVSLLWNITDFVVSESQRLKRRTEAPSEAELWLAIYSALANACIDERPEVRHSALRTLFTTLATHGVIDAATWQAVVGQVLLPTLATIEHTDMSASTEDASRALGRQNGKTVVMLMHHSRNTAQKQWDETLVVALSGVSRTLANFFPVLRAAFGAEEFRGVWTELLQHVEHAALSPSREVVQVAIASLQELLLVVPIHDAHDDNARQLWDAAWPVCDRYVGAGNTAAITTEIRMEGHALLADLVREVHTQRKSHFTTRDLLMTIELLNRIMLYTQSVAHTHSTSAIHASLLSFCSALQQPLDHEVHATILRHLLAYAVATSTPAPTTATATPDTPLYRRRVRNIPPRRGALPGPTFPEAAATQFMQLLPSAPESVCVTLMLPAIDTMSCWLDPAPGHGVWLPGVTLFEHFVLRTLPLLRNPGLLPSTSTPKVTFLRVASLLRSFLLCRGTGPVEDGDPDDWDEVTTTARIHLVDVLARQVLPLTAGLPETVQRALIAVVADCAVLAAPAEALHTPPLLQLRFATAAQEHLFQVCKNASSPGDATAIEISRQAVPLLLSYCAGVLRSLIRDDSKSGALPLPRCRIDEACTVLERLPSLYLPAEVFPTIPSPGPRHHIMCLFPLLVQCISLTEPAVKEPLQAVLMAAATDMGLGEVQLLENETGPDLL
eukprot:TRINITY_DN3599_c0_g1_i2.p1 TRINITY_DN3599_c0_g1~~TRINITY_DN3599_c0_g1_i2.p1  ORF type:complete len:992 (-),score=194.39 TRINITY_DN3599_c0_g1_i2:15-2990(-)